MTLPCGQCTGCRLERSRQWAIRCTHEAQLYSENCFITLTYNNENLPEHGTLVKKHFQDFMKRLRKSNEPKKIRYYQCGEYGPANYRPHYHAILFNHDFHDREEYREINGNMHYTSKTLTEIWGKGHCTTTENNFKTAAYVARYILSKINGAMAENYYSRTSPETGEIIQLVKEYTTMSRRPGIAADWLKQFQTDVYPSDEIAINGKTMRPPRYYDIEFEKHEKQLLQQMKGKRKRKLKLHAHNNTPERLKVRAKLQDIKLKQLPRNL